MGREKHGPYKIGMCDGCHLPHQCTEPKLLLGKQPDLCFTCHSTEDFKNKNVHRPVAEGRCSDCHGTHTSPYKGLLRADGNEACRKCHRGAFDGKHPDTPAPPDVRIQAKGGGSGHPVEKVDDPRRPGRALSCVSCHNPHSSDWSGLFRFKADKPSDICQYCHR
jgi:predicted CXXCH cytochrome family protein